MAAYTPPLRDMAFVLHDVLKICLLYTSDAADEL